MDKAVCVSQAQAERVKNALVPPKKITVIRNAIGDEAFAAPEPAYASLLGEYFSKTPKRLVGAAGRLSPEKGFDQLVEAAGLVLKQDPDIGFVLFGDGPLRARLASQIADKGIGRRFILAGFRTDLAKFLPHLDLIVLPSFTEGLPVILLEAFAAGVPAVATAVGGTGEVIQEGQSGYLVSPGDPRALAGRILEMFRDETRRKAMGEHGRQMRALILVSLNRPRHISSYLITCSPRAWRAAGVSPLIQQPCRRVKIYQHL